MAQVLLTIDMITREAIELFKNSNAFLMSVNREYDDQFAKQGAKIGQQLRIRLPNDYIVTNGPALAAQDTVEQSTTLVVASQKHVDVAFTSAERTMSMDDYSSRILKPAINNLAGAVAADLMSGVEGSISNISQNLVAGATATPTALTWNQAGAILDNNSANMSDRFIIDDPITDARTSVSLSGLLNPSTNISKQYTSGAMKNALGFDWARDQTVIKHTSGTFSAGGAVSGANQTGSAVTVTAITGTIKKGDIVTFPGAFAVNRVTKETTGELRTFVVTADVANGGTSIPIYPAIVPAVNGQKVAYQTVTASPTDTGQMVMVNPASETTRRNFAFQKQAVTMAFADLEMPKNKEVARVVDDSVSMRVLSDYITATDQWVTRIDVLYGYKWLRGEWGVFIPDSIA